MSRHRFDRAIRKLAECRIVSIREDIDDPYIGDMDYFKLLDDVEKLFKGSGINIGREEQFHEACIENGQLQGATVLAEYNNAEEPKVRFSVAVSPNARRQGIASRLIASIVNEYGSSYVLEAWVVNPAMVPLLSSLGFDEPHGGWSPNNPMMEKR